MINTRENLKLLYQEDHIIEPYIDERFSKPLGRVQHCCQVDCVNRIIEEYNVKSVLEIACGPVRLTAEIKGFEKGFAEKKASIH